MVLLSRTEIKERKDYYEEICEMFIDTYFGRYSKRGWRIFYEDSTITPMYESVSKFMVPGSDSEASIRAKDGGLNKDFMIIFQVMLLLKLLRGLLVHRRIFLNILLLHLQQIVTL